jgi:YfiH family protein
MQCVLRAQQLSAHGFAHGFATRLGGVSAAPYASLNLGDGIGDAPDAVAENQRRFAGWVGYAPFELFTVSQVHGANVRTLQPGDAPERVRSEQADGLVARAGRAVAVRTADCVPLLLADPATRTAAAIHAGWRGSVAGVVRASVVALLEASASSPNAPNASPARLLAAIFPHIRTCCFEVGAEVAQALAHVAPGAQVAHVTHVLRGATKPHVELAAVVRAQLLAAGLVAAHIEDVPGCTRCDAERFYSFRRDGSASGRHLAAIVAA